MPQIGKWADPPPTVRQHPMDRMRDRAIGMPDLNRLRLWIASNPKAPEGDWYSAPKTFPPRGQAAKGNAL
jgi:hypothetical protein